MSEHAKLSICSTQPVYYHFPGPPASSEFPQWVLLDLQSKWNGEIGHSGKQYRVSSKKFEVELTIQSIQQLHFWVLL